MCPGKDQRSTAAEVAAPSAFATIGHYWVPKRHFPVQLRPAAIGAKVAVMCPLSSKVDVLRGDQSVIFKQLTGVLEWWLGIWHTSCLILV
jgi:hypothetical protein